MSHAMDSKTAQAQLIDPMHAPEPSAETGPGASFSSTFAPTNSTNGTSSPPASPNNPYRHRHRQSKSSTTNSVGGSEKFPDYRAEAFADYQSSPRRRAASQTNPRPPSYQEATSPKPSNSATPRRRGSSLKERYPGDQSNQPLSIIRKDSKKAYRSPHLSKRSLPGADSIDRLDPAIGGRAYHHEGPYDAALMSRNRDPKTAPLAALEHSNEEAIRATPRENIRDAVERHQPLDGVAVVPPGVRDRFGRKYDYEEGAEVGRADGGAEWRYGGEEDAETENLESSLRAHNIDEVGAGAIEMQPPRPTHAPSFQFNERSERSDRIERNDRKAQADATEVNPDDDGVVASSSAADAGAQASGVKKSGLGSLRNRIGSLKKH